MRRVMLCRVLACFVMAISSSGCVRGTGFMIGVRGPDAPNPRSAQGPPPHAPAHGHRRVHDAHRGDVELVFDSDLGVYVVVDLPNHYYWNGTYLRITDDGWLASAELSGGWETCASDSLPPGLRKKDKHWKGKKHRGNGHPPDHAPAKGRW
jgi:hypothetical protein